MDPNDTLAGFRQAISRRDNALEAAEKAEASGDFRQAEKDYERADEAAQEALVMAGALDDWLSQGGFLPDAWRF